MAQETSAEMAALPRTLKVRGVELKFYPFTADDFAAMDAWMREDVLKGILPAVQDDRRKLSYAMGAVMGLSFGQPIAYSKVAQLTAIWRSMKPGQPATFTREDARKLLMGDKPTVAGWGNLADAFDAVLIVSGLIPDPLEALPDPKPATATA